MKFSISVVNYFFFIYCSFTITGVQILTLGIGAHINMGELFDITGDESLAFQNLTSQNSLDQFVNQFKKIAVGELCKFARGKKLFLRYRLT